MKGKILDIIITHRDEQWETGKKMFDMIAYQQCADMDDVSVTLVQDGDEGALDWTKLLAPYPYTVKVVTIHDHVGPAETRNIGLDSTDGEWVMFCDFDDMFGDVSALNAILQNLPTDEYDLIWMQYAKVCKWVRGEIYINTVNEASLGETDGKLYRRAMLDGKHIRFDPRAGLHYQFVFNSIILAAVPPFRIPKLTSDFYPYFKTYREDSMTHMEENLTEINRTVCARDMLLTEIFHTRGMTFNRDKAAAAAVADVYYTITDPDSGEESGIPDGFEDFYLKYRATVRAMPEAELDVVLSYAEDDALGRIQRFFNEHKREYYFQNDTQTFQEWMDELDAKIAAEREEQERKPGGNVSHTHVQEIRNEPIVHDFTERPKITKDPTEWARADGAMNGGNVVQMADTTAVKGDIDGGETAAEIREPKVVVYCGTYNVYANMLASVKSLLCTTPVDKVYFLIEDDLFPDKLPDIVECINVRSQQWIRKDGPNYDNCWTWMCMIRAAYPEIFGMYDKVLSLDIDVVIQEDISALWDYDMTDYYLAGVPEPQRQKSAEDPLYINFGVAMMNLKKMREDGVYLEAIKRLNTVKLGCPEQDAFNHCCAGKILAYPNDYNVTVYSHITGEAKKERILHYAGQRFWRHYASVRKFADLEWEEVMRRQEALHEK